MRVNGRSNRACEGRRLNIRHSFNPIGSRIPSLPLCFFFNKETVNFLPSAKMDKKEEKFFWNDSNLSNDNCENFLFLYAKKNLLYRGRKFVTRSFLPRIEQREKEKTGNRDEIIYMYMENTKKKHDLVGD